ncbi:hypothetical protein tloyanaT_15850 [Thalassotalea loyana]|uniref:Uncharacterized protein n=1 Tax=Thalassotalea loyana TaxID=280483 RepID=A0ABQ6HB32_9GAMM|nr:hypothetical protein [Thalassotalea loyana]GLX85333.1 hypothetical protein tloyanaT_15850 [Thalassotalea loyana]
MKYLALILLFYSLGASASVPRECVQSKDEINSALIVLADATKAYIKRTGSFPGVWSSGLTEIIESSEKIVNVGGNIDPIEGDNAMQLSCFSFKDNSYSIYRINIKTYEVSFNQLFVKYGS